MAANIIDGKKLASEIKARLKDEVKNLKQKPGLAIIIIGENIASEIYVKNKLKACEEVGIYSELRRLSGDVVSEKRIIEIIDKLNSNEKISGIIVQMPLPDHLNEQKIIDSICPLKDVDGLTTYNQGKLARGDLSGITPATPSGVIKLIESTGERFEGKRAVVLGRSILVGRPAAVLLELKNCTVTVCHSKTPNTAEICREADILIAAVGKPALVKKDMVKKGAIVIDVGINREGADIKGDVDFENVKEVAGFITPVPGGVGPMTVACLLENVI
ncbi:TPA: bifunctional 5,10-methylenetetrahydrofolate dehydrogenase/5,10-methenyltetrahydrofolate cyclohydrolase, partial [archaeon]|nr:bifunctional 5,10-methylenetetrahydrofolate dehydrogenase/5,10-methenyltetrahydrofolate cyclohydrolase [Candidatus Naiadarchaeales archaeon SRR2090159.bin1288]